MKLSKLHIPASVLISICMLACGTRAGKNSTCKILKNPKKATEFMQSLHFELTKDQHYEDSLWAIELKRMAEIRRIQEAYDSVLSARREEEAKNAGKPTVEELRSEKVYTTVLQSVSYTGGVAAFYDFIKDELQVCSSYLKFKSGSEAVITFDITELSAIENIQWKGQFNAEFEKSINAIILESKANWRPARMNGNKVGAKAILKITIRK